MAGRRLIWRIAPAYALVLAGGVVLLSLYAGRLASVELNETQAVNLKHAAVLIARGLSDEIDGGVVRDPKLDRACAQVALETGLRVALLDLAGRVLADSGKDASLVGWVADPERIAAVLAGGVALGRRHEVERGVEVQYAVTPVWQGDAVAALIYAESSTETTGPHARRVSSGTMLAGLLVGTVVFVAALALIQHRVVAPLKRLEQGVERFAEGELDQGLLLSGSYEFRSINAQLETMASRLAKRIDDATHRSREQQAVLASMVEGVIAVDTRKRLLGLNKTAAGFIGVDADTQVGRSIYEVVRNTSLQQFVDLALTSEELIETELPLRVGEQESVLQAHGTVLRDERGARVGAVIVLHDITRLRELERVRRQFVANVSHELKTPISAIKAAAETLADLRSSGDENEQRFQGIICRQADRLGAIVEDLLCIARLEQDQERLERQTPLTRQRLRPVLEAAVQTCQPSAEARRVSLSIQAPPQVEATLNAPLLEQAVVNLLDNAVKYSPEGGTVDLRITDEPGHVVVSVIDRGCGIDAGHLPRIFERFYRVDAARDRRLGGTGLGLAIVKHVAQLHGGSVGVESTTGVGPERGSVFRIQLPKKQAELPVSGEINKRPGNR